MVRYFKKSAYAVRRSVVTFKQRIRCPKKMGSKREGAKILIDVHGYSETDTDNQPSESLPVTTFGLHVWLCSEWSEWSGACDEVN